MTATSRNSVFYQRFLQLVEEANPAGDIYAITDNLSSHNSVSTRTWLEDHPRIKHVFIPVGACWLNLQEGWWRIFRKTALAGRSFGDPGHITHATTMPPTSLPTSLTPVPGPGSGADPHHPPGAYAAAMCTSFEESSTRSGLGPVRWVVCPAGGLVFEVERGDCLSTCTVEAEAEMKGIAFPAWQGPHYVTMAELLVGGQREGRSGLP